LVAAVNHLQKNFGYRELLDALFATGVSNEKISLFLEKDVDRYGSLHNRVLARMTNEVMGALGQPSKMSAEDVKKVRRQIEEGKSPSLTDQEVVDYSQLPHKD
jgi:phage tail tape-measure protein